MSALTAAMWTMPCTGDAAANETANAVHGIIGTFYSSYATYKWYSGKEQEWDTLITLLHSMDVMDLNFC